MEDYIDIGIDLETATTVNAIAFFDPFKVKIGNIKKDDKEKIEAKRKEAKAKFIKESTLDPLTSFVCAIGVKWKDGDATHYRRFIATKESEERQLLMRFWEIAKVIKDNSNDSKIVSFLNVPRFNYWGGLKGNDFDKRFILQRSFANHVAVPSEYLEKFSKQWRNLTDTFVGHQYGAGCKLEYAAKLCGVARERAHQIKGAGFYKALLERREDAEQYLKDDVLEMWDLMNIMYK